MRVGIHGLNEQEKKEVARKAVLTRGKIPWVNFLFDPETEHDEHDYCVNLLNDPNYKYKRGNTVCVNLSAIAQKLNEVFHDGKNVRTRSSVSNFRYQRLKR